MGKFVTVEVRSKLAQQKLVHEFSERGIPETEYLSRTGDGGSATFKVPQDMCDLLFTDSDFRRGHDYKVISGTIRRNRKRPVKPRRTVEQIVGMGLVGRGTKNLPPRTHNA